MLNLKLPVSCHHLVTTKKCLASMRYTGTESFQADGNEPTMQPRQLVATHGRLALAATNTCAPFAGVDCQCVHSYTSAVSVLPFTPCLQCSTLARNVWQCACAHLGIASRHSGGPCATRHLFVGSTVDASWSWRYCPICGIPCATDAQCPLCALPLVSVDSSEYKTRGR